MSKQFPSVGKYQIVEEIGRGGMGAVYKALDPSLDRMVAVKLLAPHLVWEQEFVERFLREARAVAKLNHPNIISIHDVGQDGDNYYFVMAYLPGASLKSLIKQKGRMAPIDAIAILRPLASALDYAHTKGLIHRDVKPVNVIFDELNRPVLTDFGIVKAALESKLTATGASMGTPQYMAPEQALGKPIDARADQYALAIITFELLTGNCPFDADTTPAILYKQVQEPPPSLRQLMPDLPPGLETVLNKALSKNPDDRYVACTDFVDALERAATQTEPKVMSSAVPAALDRNSTQVLGTTPAVPVDAPKPLSADALTSAPVLAPAEAPTVLKPLPTVIPIHPATPASSWRPATVPIAQTRPAPRKTTVPVWPIVLAVVVLIAVIAAVLVLSRPTSSPQAVAVTGTPAATPSATTAVPEPTSTLAVQSTSPSASTEVPASTDVPATAVAQATPADTAPPPTTPSLTAPSPTMPSPTAPPPTAQPTGGNTTPTTALFSFEQPFNWKRGDQPYGDLTQSTEQAHDGSASARLTYSIPNVTDHFVVFINPTKLPGQPTGLIAWVYGDGSGNFLDMWVQDSTSQIRQFTFGRIMHKGWQQMTAWFDVSQPWPQSHISGPNANTLSYPLAFYAFVLDLAGNVNKGVIYIDEVNITDQPLPVQASATPQATPPVITQTVTAGTTATPPPATGNAVLCNQSMAHISNLCVGANPVAKGGATYAIWRIETTFIEGCFDKGDGKGCAGPITAEMRVDLPDIAGPRTITLSWLDGDKAQHSDSITIFVQ